MIFRCALATGLAMFLAGSAWADAPFLNKRATWIGSGVFRESPDAALQRGRCQFDATPLEDGKGTNVSGKCASPSGSSRVTLRIERRGENRVAAGLSLSIRDDVVQYIGTESPTGITLVSRDINDNTGPAGPGLLRVEWIDETHIRLSDRLATKSGSITMLEMTFEAQAFVAE